MRRYLLSLLDGRLEDYVLVLQRYATGVYGEDASAGARRHTFLVLCLFCVLGRPATSCWASSPPPARKPRGFTRKRK